MNEFKKNEDEKIFEKERGLTIIEKHEQFYTVKDKKTGDIYTIFKDEVIKPKTKKEKTQTILGIIFLIWFFCSLGLMIYFAEVKPIYAVIGFGQYFLVFGLIAVFNKVWPGFIFVIVGLAAIIIPVLMLMPKVNINWNFVLPILLLSTFILVGICLIFVPTIVKVKQKKKASLKVMGKVIDLKASYEDGTKVYAPVYEFYFNGKTYQVESNLRTNIKVPNIDEIVEIMIDPNNPTEIYVENVSKTFTIGLFIMGVFFVIAGAGSLYLFLMTK